MPIFVSTTSAQVVYITRALQTPNREWKARAGADIRDPADALSSLRYLLNHLYLSGVLLQAGGAAITTIVSQVLCFKRAMQLNHQYLSRCCT